MKKMIVRYEVSNDDALLYAINDVILETASRYCRFRSCDDCRSYTYNYIKIGGTTRSCPHAQVDVMCKKGYFTENDYYQLHPRHVCPPETSLDNCEICPHYWNDSPYDNRCILNILDERIKLFTHDLFEPAQVIRDLKRLKDEIHNS